MERLIIQQPTPLAKTVFIQSVSEFGKRVQWEHQDSWEFFRTRKEKKPTRRSRSRRHLGDDTEISEGKYPPHQCLKPPPPHERSLQEPLSDGVHLHVLLKPPKRLCDSHEYIKIKAGNLFHWNTCRQIPSSQRKSNLLLDFILWKILYLKLFLVVLLPSCSIIFFSSETALLWSDYT
ncbi:uncharacterized protein ACNLHF_018711 isoform 1-T3 [Anomaloglossus baeobatrachus]